MIIAILSPIILCAASIWLGYILGQRKARRRFDHQLSELKHENLPDITLKVIEGLKKTMQNKENY